MQQITLKSIAEIVQQKNNSIHRAIKPIRLIKNPTIKPDVTNTYYVLYKID